MVADQFADAFRSATKDLLADKKRRERDARKSRVATRVAHSRVTLREAVFRVMADAAAAASEDGRYEVPARNLYYAVRPLVQRIVPDELSYKYFDKILVQYQQTIGPIRGLYRDPRGELLEPHTGRTVPMGTREVAAYAIPDYLYGAILYVEKEGFGPILRQSKLAERYDLAIVSGKGQPVEAVRELFARAETGDYKLFVLHDADHHGYSIARTIAEETERMPDHCVEVVDLGLSVADAVRRDMPTEQYTRRNDLPWWMPSRLVEVERQWFEGRRISYYPTQWECTRVELNAFAPSDLIAYIEAGLELNDVAKVIPPEEKIAAEAQTRHRVAVRMIVEEILAETIDLDALSDTVVDETSDAASAVDRAAIEEALTETPAASWREVVEDAVDASMDERDDETRARVRELLTAALRNGGAA